MYLHIEVRKMNKINNDFKQELFEFTTQSGLHVNLIHRPGFKKSVAVYATPFGALNLSQRIDGKVVQHKSGVAHFLEHKLFEDEKKDVLSQFSDMGANGNAFTSYDHTMYYFSHNGDIKPPLKLLLNFVSSLSVTEASVEKEKGIIVEEINMYAQKPYFRLINETYQAVFHNYPFIYDIAGTEDSVNATTVEDLYNAYNANYSDTRMALVVVSPEDPMELKSFIEACTKDHKHNGVAVEDIFEEEPDTVKESFVQLYDTVETPKMSLTYKIPFKSKQKQKDEFLLSIILDMSFTEFNDNYQNWIDQRIISNSFNYGVDVRDTFAMITFINEGERIEEFKALIDREMESIELNEDYFDQLAKRYFGHMISSLEKPDDLAIVMARSYFDGMDYFDYLTMIRDIQFEDLEKVLQKITTINQSYVVMSNLK